MRTLLLKSLIIIYALVGCKSNPEKEMTHRQKVRKNAIKYIETANYNRWGTFIDAKDTLYFDGVLVVFDTINLIYRTIGTVTIHPIK